MTLHAIRRALTSKVSLRLGAAILAAFVAWSVEPAAGQMMINFDGGGQILDGGTGDLDATVNGKIDFSGVYGLAGYLVSGTLRETPPWGAGPSIIQQLSPPLYSLTLTNFTAEALSTSSLGVPLDLRFNSDPFAGLYAAGTGVGSIVAEVGSSTATPILPNTDQVTMFQGIIADNVNTALLAPPTGAPLPMGNPAHPGSGTTPYPATGLGLTPTPAYINPTIYGLIELSLGQVGDQFLMPSSLEIGFTAVPEPASVALFALGMIGVVAVGRRRIARRKCR